MLLRKLSNARAISFLDVLYSCSRIRFDDAQCINVISLLDIFLECNINTLSTVLCALYVHSSN